MSDRTWHGIPRSKIPWYPTIDYEKCITCGKCVDFCHMKVFATEEKEGKKRTVVENPNSCVVTCTGCDSICPAGAMKHPSKREFQEKIRALRKRVRYSSGFSAKPDKAKANKEYVKTVKHGNTP